MDEIKIQFGEIKKLWGSVYGVALGNPSAWKPHLPNTSLEVLNEAVDTVSTWIERSRAPGGFSPGYHLARSLAAIHIPSLLNTVKQLEAGNYNHLPNFTNTLVNTLSAIHTMAVYAPKSDQESINADFTAELSQALSLLNTAQKELANKLEILKDAQTLAEEITASHQVAQNSVKEIEAHNSSIAEYDASAKTLLDSANSSLEEIEKIHNDHIQEVETQKNEYEKLLHEHIEEHEKLTGNSKSLYKKLEIMSNELSRLQDKCKEQEAVIDSILPRGASAGLAAAFSARGGQLNPTKWIWLTVFVVSLLVLTAFAWNLINMPLSEGKTFAEQLLTRLPLAAPMVWLGWFSAIQYGNTIRVQEDYAFKEATSKAFQGYKDHMEHLGNVNIEEARTALTLLSETTINVLGREPLRIYGKTEQDASPTHTFAQFLRSDKQNKSPEVKGQ